MVTNRSHTARLAGIVLALGLTSALVGCENSVEPFAETTRHFALYGFLDAEVDTQYVRVEPTRPLPELATPAEIPSVETTDLETGARVQWRDSSVVLEDGTQAILFWAPFRPLAGHRYQIAVERSDGAVSTATTLVPDFLTSDVRIPSRTFAGTFEQAVVFENVRRRPEKVTVNYGLAFTSDDDPTQIRLDYNIFGAPIERGWQINVRLTRDRERVNSRLGVASSRVLWLHDVSMTVRVLSDDWPLVEEDNRPSNVENGFGFFGSAATHSVTWQIDSLVAQELGYEDSQNGESGGL